MSNFILRRLNKVVSLIIAQVFLITSLSWAAPGGTFSLIGEDNTLSPTIQVGQSPFLVGFQNAAQADASFSQNVLRDGFVAVDPILVEGLESVEVAETLSEANSLEGPIESKVDLMHAQNMAAIEVLKWINTVGSRFAKEKADGAGARWTRHYYNQGIPWMRGTVVIGEGERDKAAMLYIGEEVGGAYNTTQEDSDSIEVDIAGDVVELTNGIVKTGILGTVSVASYSEKGGTLNAPDIYMTKWAVGPAAKGCGISTELSLEENLSRIADKLGKEVSGLRGTMLFRERHVAWLVKFFDAGIQMNAQEDKELSALINAYKEFQSHKKQYLGNAKGTSSEADALLKLKEVKAELIKAYKALDKKVKAAGKYRIGNFYLLADGDLMPVWAMESVEKGEIDFLTGAGGAPEAVLAASAVETMGGEMVARLCAYEILKETASSDNPLDWPDVDEDWNKFNDKELARLAGFGYDSPETLGAARTSKELISGKDVVFIATAIKDSPWLKNLKGVSFDAQTGLITVYTLRATKSGDKKIWKFSYKTPATELKAKLAVEDNEVNKAELRYQLSSVYGRVGRLDLAMGEIRQAVSTAGVSADNLNKYQAALYFYQAKMALLQEKDQEVRALGLLEAAYKVYHKDEVRARELSAELAEFMADNLAKTKDYVKAVEYYRHALRLFPENEPLLDKIRKTEDSLRKQQQSKGKVLAVDTLEFSGLRGRDLFDALEATEAGRKMIVPAFNIRVADLSYAGIIRAAKAKGSIIEFQKAKSELGYTHRDKKAILHNIYEFAQEVREACAKEGFNDFIIKGDHLTTKVDEAFLTDKAAQEAVKGLFDRILATKDKAARKYIFLNALEDKKFMANANTANAMKVIKEVFDMILAEVDAGYSVFAIDASWMPMPLNVRITAFFHGMIPADRAIVEGEVGEIDGNNNSTPADAVEFLTGVRYAEEIEVSNPKTGEKRIVASTSEIKKGEEIDDAKLVKDAAGNYVELYRGEGLINFIAAEEFIRNIAVKNGSAHGNQFDENNNPIPTKLKPRLTKSIHDTVNEFMKPYGIKVRVVQHGITGTPLENMQDLRRVGIRSGHVGTQWQNLVWDELIPAAKENTEVMKVVEEILTWTANLFGKKYLSEADQTPERIKELVKRYIAQYGQAKMEASDKAFDKLISKEIKNANGPFTDQLKALPQWLKDRINNATQKSAEEYFDAFKSTGAAQLVVEYLTTEDYIRDTFGSLVFTAEQYAQKRGISNEEAQRRLETAWRNFDNIDRVKLSNGNKGYWYNSIGVAIQLGSNTMPKDIPAGAAMRVIVGHSAVMERGMTVAQKKAQLDAFRDTGYKIIFPFGDFPETLKGVDYLKGGQRKFAVTFETIKEQARLFGGEYAELFADASDVEGMRFVSELRTEYADYYSTLQSVVTAGMKKMLADGAKDEKAVALVLDARGRAQINVANLILRQYPEHGQRILKELNVENYFLTVEDFKLYVEGKAQIPELDKFISNVNEFILDDLAMVKELIIKEISTVHDINSQIRALFKDVPVEQVLHQIKESYEPVEGIKTVAISNQLQVLRKEKMIQELVQTSIPRQTTQAQAIEIAKALGYTQLSDVQGEHLKQKLDTLRAVYKEKLEAKIIYGGGANAANFKEVSGIWGNAGAFIGRAILDVKDSVKIAVSAARAPGRPDVIMNFKAERDGSLKEWMDALKAANIDLAKDVKVTLGVLLHDAVLTMRQLQGIDVSDLLEDQSQAKFGFTIDARTAEVGTEPADIKLKGPTSGNIRAEFLSKLGVKTVVIDGMQSKDTVMMQVRNLVKAGIDVVIVHKDAEDGFTVDRDKIVGTGKIDIVTSFDSSKTTPIGELRTTAAVAKMLSLVNLNQEPVVLVGRAI
ncbi:MAG: fructose-bisphosphatase class II [Candidatus Omnitrophica bacterium]|nr:fructose-bisphosphatase class II [Candidatus Omnitrophota bacterium]